MDPHDEQEARQLEFGARVRWETRLEWDAEFDRVQRQELERQDASDRIEQDAQDRLDEVAERIDQQAREFAQRAQARIAARAQAAIDASADRIQQDAQRDMTTVMEGIRLSGLMAKRRRVEAAKAARARSLEIARSEDLQPGEPASSSSSVGAPQPSQRPIRRLSPSDASAHPTPHQGSASAQSEAHPAPPWRLHGRR